MVLLTVLSLIVGIGLILYPSVSDIWNRYHQTRAVATYVQKTKDMSKEQKRKLLAQAQAYNEKLSQKKGLSRFSLSKEELKEYEETLDITGTGIMGYISIPSIDVSLPIYHGDSEAVLQIATGHLPGSSLPIGGKGTHSVITGHTGDPSARLLTDLARLKEGDTFSLVVLDTTLTYQVDQISKVYPDDFSKIGIDSNQDYSTVITCTPYGINTQRLLVRGHRTKPDTLANKAVGNVRAIWKDVAIITVLLAIVIVVFIILFFKKKKTKNDEEASLEGTEE